MSRKSLAKILKDLKGQVTKLKSAIAEKKKKEEVKNVKPPRRKKGVDQVLVSFSLANVAKATFVVLLLLLAAAFVYEIRQILLIVGIAYLLSAALMPTVSWLHRRKVPRAVSVIVIYILALSALVVFISSFVPILGVELLELGRNVQTLLVGVGSGEVTVPWLNFMIEPIQDFIANADFEVLFADLEGYLVDLGRKFSSLAGNAIGFLVAFSNGILNLVLVLVLSFFFVVERDSVHRFIVALFPARYEEYIIAKNEAIQVKIGHWLQGQLVLMIAVATITYIGLLILGVKYAITLAAFAGLAELLPVIGPLIAFLVAVPIVANQALWLILAVGILFFVIQQLENNVLVPLIMKKAVGLNPIVIILAMLVGFQFLGILGLIISVPVATTVGVFFSDYLRKD